MIGGSIAGAAGLSNAQGEGGLDLCDSSNGGPEGEEQVVNERGTGADRQTRTPRQKLAPAGAFARNELVRK